MESVGRPLTLTSLAGHFGIRSSRHQSALGNRLKAMIRDGQLIRNRVREYCLVQHLDLVTGEVHAHRDGYGFLTPDKGGDDIFLPSREMARLWDGDRIAARVSPTDRGKEGRVVEILQRFTQEVFGRLVRERGIDLVAVTGRERTRVLIPRGQTLGAKAGDMVRVQIDEHPTRRTDAIGHVSRVVGRFDDPGAQTTMAILAHGLPHEFSPEVMAQAAELPVHVTARARRGREDLRDLPLVTIDGADAKDFDDAVYCERQGDGWRLIVAIADVGYYVLHGTDLDSEARARGTSVYFPDRVIPMLPEGLSNGLCSLQPFLDRLCLCCEMAVSPRGEVTESRFFEAVMRSARRFTYADAAEELERLADKAAVPELQNLASLEDVYRAFAKRRRRRGALEFELGEISLELGDRGEVVAVAPAKRLITHRIIEECMIAANVEAAKYLRKARIPALYRVHDSPSPERVEELALVLRTLGIRLSSPHNVQTADLSRVLKETTGGPAAELVETVVLRSMARADYRPKNLGHFGLALPAYAHFTSPIRRYPDLLVHRAIKHLLHQGSPGRFTCNGAEMEQLGMHCSRTEKRADEAVREVEERLKCAFLQSRLGDVFSVTVAGIAPFGLFVRIPELRTDGLVHVTALPRDYYRVDAGGTALTGENTKTRFQLTDRLEVRLASVDVQERKIDFIPVESVRDVRS